MIGIQEKLSRVRPPRVHITFDKETNGAMEKKQLPCIIGVIGQFGNACGLENKQFVEIDPDNFFDIMKGCDSRIDIKINKKNSTEKMDIGLSFNSIEDFLPNKIVDQLGFLKNKIQQSQKLSDLFGKIETNKKLFVALSGFVDRKKSLLTKEAQTVKEPMKDTKNDFKKG
jgi:type VI secretion system protein ImpB